MRMRETWLAISPSKKTLLVLKLGSQKASKAEDVWFAVSEESTNASR
jgi:hypothetical protein